MIRKVHTSHLGRISLDSSQKKRILSNEGRHFMDESPSSVSRFFRAVALRDRERKSNHPLRTDSFVPHINCYVDNIEIV